MSVTQPWKKFWQDRGTDIHLEAKSSHSSLSEYERIFMGLLDVRPGQHILEVGVGTGRPVALEVARSRGNLAGLDISERLLRVCQQSFAQEDLPAALFLGDGEDLPFRDETFDTVYAFGTLWLFPDIQKALTEMARVTKRGGKLVFETINYLHPSQFFSYQCVKYANVWRERVQGWSADRLPAGKPRTPGELGRILRKLGLEYQSKGFSVLLPVSLPLLGARANLCQYSHYFSYGLQDHPLLKLAGAKLVYTCEKGQGGG